ncbi:MAG TPA: glycosyltransferase family 4 protein [Hyphomicrobiaceae bacterium]|nr:glycosyltransferase family 4 protein [Hyphomicrobiaceae bacterium]
MARALFAIPGDLFAPTGGYAYDRRVLALLPEHGVEAGHVALPGSYPAPTAADLEATARALSAAPQGAVLLIDGLAYGAMPAALIERFDAPVVALVHHPLCLETGLSADRQAELHRLETEALARAHRVVVTSPATARTLAAEFAVPAERITVAEPGTDPAPRARGTGTPLRMLAVGSLIPRKGYEILVEALRPLRHIDWRLDIAGALDAHSDTPRRVREAIERAGMTGRIALHGALDDRRLAELYAGADLFVMPSLYEGYGMALAEALARGLPIVCTTGGAAAETVPDEAALKVVPGDARALMWVLGRALEDGALRQRMADAAWAAAARLPRWPDTARRIARVILEVAQ